MKQPLGKCLAGALPRAGREPGEFTYISYRYRQRFPDDIHVWTLTRRVEACSGVSMRQEGLASEQEGFAVPGSLGRCCFNWSSYTPSWSQRTFKQERARHGDLRVAHTYPFPMQNAELFPPPHPFPIKDSLPVHTHPQQQHHLKAAWTLLPPNCGALRTPFRQLINVQVTLHCPHGTHFPGPEIIKVTVAGDLPRNPNSPVIPEVFLGLVSLCLS